MMDTTGQEGSDEGDDVKGYHLRRPTHKPKYMIEGGDYVDDEDYEEFVGRKRKKSSRKSHRMESGAKRPRQASFEDEVELLGDLFQDLSEGEKGKWRHVEALREDIRFSLQSGHPKHFAFWTREDDHALKDAILEHADFKRVKKEVKFSRQFWLREMQERWFALLYQPGLLKPLLEPGGPRRPKWTREEEEVILRAVPEEGMVFGEWARFLEERQDVFHPTRTVRGLEAHFKRMRRAGLYSKYKAAGGVFPGASNAGFGGNEGAPVDGGVFFHLTGKSVAFDVRRAVTVWGRSVPGAEVDVDLSKEVSEHSKVLKLSRRQCEVRLGEDNCFHLRNMGKHAVRVDGVAVLRGDTVRLPMKCAIEVAKQRFQFEADETVIGQMSGGAQ